MPQVHVAAPRAVSVIPDSGQLCRADPGRPEHGDQGSVAALREPAPAGALQPRQVPCGEDRDGLVGDAGWLQPGHGVADLFLGGQPLEELLQGTVLVAGVRAAVPVQQPDNPPLDVLLADLFPGGRSLINPGKPTGSYYAGKATSTSSPSWSSAPGPRSGTRATSSPSTIGTS